MACVGDTGISFQFTPLREGRQLKKEVDLLDVIISIPAPPRGATILADAGYVPIKFQFTPLREGRQQKICNFCKSFVQPSQITVL